AVDVAELRARLGDVGVRVPATSAEERRREPELAETCPLDADALARAWARWTSMVGSGPVRVVPERSASCRLPGPLDPGLLVLAERRVRRPHECRNRKTSRAGLLQRGEARPHRVVEGSL